MACSSSCNSESHPSRHYRSFAKNIKATVLWHPASQEILRRVLGVVSAVWQESQKLLPNQITLRYMQRSHSCNEGPEVSERTSAWLTRKAFLKANQHDSEDLGHSLPLEQHPGFSDGSSGPGISPGTFWPNSRGWRTCDPAMSSCQQKGGLAVAPGWFWPRHWPQLDRLQTVQDVWQRWRGWVLKDSSVFG